MQITALHGFLGRPRDWKLLFEGTSLEHNIFPLDLFQEDGVPGLGDWANSFNALQRCGAGSSANILMGYSMGGRLALHALITKPSIWQGAVIVSAHPGLKNTEQKEKKRKDDAIWASRFESDDWTSLMRLWGSQEVFSKDSYHFERQEAEYRRSSLSSCLRKWSLSNQDDLQDKISYLNLPILWIAGESDAKYVAQASRMAFSHPQSKIWIAPQSGHRVPWEVPELFISELLQFLSQIK